MNNFENQIAGISLKKSATIAGIALLIMAIIAPIANFVIIQGLIDPNDAANTVNNLSSSYGIFHLGIFLFLIVALLDILVAWALYLFLIPVNKPISLLTAWLRVVYATVLIIMLIGLIRVLVILNYDAYLPGPSTENINMQVMFSLNTFNQGWEFSLIVFGFHLLLLGYLLYKAGYMRKILGLLIILAALGYLIDGLGKLLLPDYNLTISMFTFIGEVILIFWLLIKGRKLEKKIT